LLPATGSTTPAPGATCAVDCAWKKTTFTSMAISWNAPAAIAGNTKPAASCDAVGATTQLPGVTEHVTACTS
jgi:hypothetical protein